METLPYLALKEIVQQLTPQDLAHCSAVCREWRDLFNQDWIWKSHCDPELEEPLRTIPSVALTSAVSSSHLREEKPEVENSTLSPICHWRLAYMRENQLWNNWRDKKLDIGNIRRIGTYSDLKKADPILHFEFLTDTRVVVFHSKYIEIFDVSKDPVSLAKTDGAVRIEQYVDKCYVVGTTMLLVEKVLSVEVYNVDLTEKVITLKHCITLSQNSDDLPPYAVKECQRRLFKEHYLLLVDDEQRSNLKIFDLNVGERVKEEPFPGQENTNKNIPCITMRSFSNSDLVAVVLDDYVLASAITCYIYNIKHLTFLPDLVFDLPGTYPSIFLLHRNWMAYQEYENVSVYDIQTRQVLLHHEMDFFKYPQVWDDNYIFIENSKQLWKKWLKQYSPEQKTMMTILEREYTDKWSFYIINEKALIIGQDDAYSHRAQCLWKHSNNKMVMRFELPFHKMDIIMYNLAKVNQSFTRTIFVEDHESFILYSW